MGGADPTADIESIIEAKQELLARRFGRREIPSISIKNSSQSNAELQYLCDLLKHNLTYTVQNLHRDVCRAQ
jgi:hypothetical protein